MIASLSLLTSACAVAYLLAAGVAQTRGRAGAALLAAAWLLHAAVLAAGLMAVPARFGFAPALSATLWLVVLVYGLESRLHALVPLRGWLALAGAGTVLLGGLFPGGPLPAPASPWLAVHLLLAVASYGLFASAVLHAWMLARADQRLHGKAVARWVPDMPLLALERLTVHMVLLGFVVLTLTIAQGVGFTQQTFGPHGVAWRWNHKNVFSVLAWLVFVALLWGRWRLGWRGLRMVRMVYVGAVLLLLGYAGSDFVLHVILQRG